MSASLLTSSRVARQTSIALLCVAAWLAPLRHAQAREEREVLQPQREFVDGDEASSSLAALPAPRPFMYEPAWRWRWRIGLDLAMARAVNRFAAYNGDALTFGVHDTTSLSRERAPHLAAFSLSLDERWLGRVSRTGRGFPLQKLVDEVGFQGRYTYLLGPKLGIYARGQLRSALFNTYLYPDRRLTMRFVRPDGTTQRIRTGVPDEGTRIFQRFVPAIFQQDVGLSAPLLTRRTLQLEARVGGGARQALYRESAFVREQRGDEVVLEVLEDKAHFGATMGATLRFEPGERLRVQSALDAFFPHDRLAPSLLVRPILRFESAAQLELGRFASLVYELSLRRDDVQVVPLQVRQDVSLRLVHDLF